MIKKYSVELEGQIEFYEQYLKIVNPNLIYEDIFRNNIAIAIPSPLGSPYQSHSILANAKHGTSLPRYAVFFVMVS